MERFFKALFSEPFSRAICFTLIHSLWQGMLLGLVSAIIIGLTRNKTALIRYRLLVSALFVFIVGFGITFSLEMNGHGISLPGGSSLKQGASGALDIFLKPLTSHSAIITFIWMVLVSYKISNLLIGWYKIDYQRSRAVPPDDEFWQKILKIMARQMGLRRPVKLLESVHVDVPSLIGFFEPAILVPAGFLSHLPPDEIEAIFFHELAHIFRSDYLINIFQNIFESLLFFNPGVVWVCKLIRDERENCCDDLAILRIGESPVYVRAMVHFEERRLQPSKATQAFAGEPGSMVQRVRRLVNQRNRSLGKFEMLMIMVTMLIGAFLIRVIPGTRNPFTVQIPIEQVRQPDQVERAAKLKAEREDLRRQSQVNSPQ